MFKYFNLNEELHIKDDPEVWEQIGETISESQTILKWSLKQYEQDPNSPPWLQEILQRFPVELDFYFIVPELDQFFVHAGAIDIVSAMLNYIPTPGIQDRFIDKVYDRACQMTSDDTSLKGASLRAHNIDMIWREMSKHIGIEAELQYVLEIERQIMILSRDAIEEPWSTVAEKFSLGLKS